MKPITPLLAVALLLPVALHAEPVRELTISTFPIADDPLFVTCQKVLLANSMEAGFRKLLAGHADVHIDAKISGLFMLKRIGYRHIYISAPLNIHTLHHHLNSRHTQLVGKLNNALAQMQQDGSLARIERSVNEPWQ